MKKNSDMAFKNKMKLTHIRSEIERALDSIAHNDRVGDHTITVKIHSSSGGGLAAAKVGAAFEAGVKWDEGNG